MSGADPQQSKSSFYSGRTVILPDVSQLRSGDVLLSRTTSLASLLGGIQSKKIQMRTGGSFSHALICSEPPTMVEAIKSGVSTLSLSRCFAHEWDSIRLLRHPDAALAQAAASAAQLQVGRDYSIRRALRAGFPGAIADRVADLGTFCSALVAQSYVGVGDALFAQVPIELTTPATIERIDGLTDITRLVFHEGLAPRNVGTLVPLDAHPDPSPSARQTEISGRYAKALMSDAELVAAALCPPVEIIPTHYGMLDLVMKALDALQHQTDDSSLAAVVDRLDVHLAEFIASGELAQLHTELEILEAEELQEAVKASFDAIPDIDRDAMRGQLETTRRGLEVRRKAVTGMEEWNGSGRSKAVASYAALERQALSSIERRDTIFTEILGRLGNAQ